MTTAREVIAFVHPKPPGPGGLGRLAEDALRALWETGAKVHAFGPAAPERVRRTLPGVTWYDAPSPLPAWLGRWTWLRWWTGHRTYLEMRRLGRWAAREVARLEPDRCYLFAETALETLHWAHARGVPAVVDNPTGDVRHFRTANVREVRHWLGADFRGHPSEAMERRTVEEYALASVVRVASTFSRDSMTAAGVPPSRVAIVRYPVDVTSFIPRSEARDASGPLRACYVATIALAKGFPYLLDAVREADAHGIAIELVGGTDSRGSFQVLSRLRAGLRVVAGAADDLVAAYQRCDLFILPTLHDGWGFVVAEAMACGLPAVVTDACGAADLVEHGRTGWVVPAGDARALATVLREAVADRARVARMGEAAREAVVAHAFARAGEFGSWWRTQAPPAVRD